MRKVLGNAPQAKNLDNFWHLLRDFFSKILANWDAKCQNFQPAAHCPAPYAYILLIFFRACGA
jgi:hypothetical protein